MNFFIILTKVIIKQLVVKVAKQFQVLTLQFVNSHINHYIIKSFSHLTIVHIFTYNSSESNKKSVTCHLELAVTNSLWGFSVYIQEIALGKMNSSLLFGLSNTSLIQIDKIIFHILFPKLDRGFSEFEIFETTLRHDALKCKIY